MNITTINQTPTLNQTPASKPVAPAPQQADAPSRLAQDVVKKTEIQKGIVPTLKGAGAGLVGGALAAGIPITLVAIAAKGGSGDGGGALVAFVVGVSAAAVGATSGAVSGAVVANQTASKGK